MKIMKNNFSINDTSIEFKKDCVKKTYILKKIPNKETKKVSKLILKYYFDLKKSKISIPKLLSSNGLTFNFENCGSSLMDILKKDNITFTHMENLLNQIEVILKKCRKNNIGLDPHIKNFICLDNKVFYVDTFPPVSKEYISLLTKYNFEYSREIRLHLKNYNPDKLAYHFLADLKKTKELNTNFYKIAKKSFIQKRFIRKFDLRKVNEIIKIEESNVKKKGFSLS